MTGRDITPQFFNRIERHIVRNDYAVNMSVPAVSTMLDFNDEGAAIDVVFPKGTLTQPSEGFQ